MKPFSFLSIFALAFLSIFTFSCTNDPIQNASVILEDPLYFEFENAFQGAISFSSADKERFRRIGDILYSCDVDNDDSCSIIDNECIRENADAVKYFQYHCAMMVLQEQIQGKYNLSKKAFLDLRIQDLKSRTVSHPYK